MTELKDKVPAFADIDPAAVHLAGALDDKRAPKPVTDAVSALVNLGYGQPQAAAAIAAASRNAGEGADVQTLIRQGLKELAKLSKLTAKDKELIDAATKAIKQRYRNDWQEVGAAMRTRDGRIVTGVNLDAYVGRGAVCAEAVAIGTRADRKRRSGHRDHRRGAPPEARREGRDRGGVPVRHLPRTHPRLRRQGARDRAERQGASR